MKFRFFHQYLEKKLHSEGSFTKDVDDLLEQIEGLNSSRLQEIKSFISLYQEETAGKTPKIKVYALLQFLLSSLKKLITAPYQFDNYHQMIPSHYQWSLELTEQLIDFPKSSLLGLHNVQKIDTETQAGNNVLLFSNHQTELDPQIIMSLLRLHDTERLGKNMIFVAGHRVTQDVYAQPFSMGCNLLNVYAKKYLQTPPEQERYKRAFNQITFKKLLQLLGQGGKCIFVAAAGGRDRQNPEGKVELQPFDPEGIALLKLLAKKSQVSTKICPLAIKSFDLLHPPSKVHSDLGEKRHPKYSPVFLHFGQLQPIDKQEPTHIQDSLFHQVSKLYATFPP